MYHLDALQALIRWDFVWQAPGAEGLRPGIPSFVAYTQQRYHRDLPPATR